MTKQQTCIVSNPSLVPYPYIFMEYVAGQGYKITITLPADCKLPSDSTGEAYQLLSQAQTQNPAQLAAANAAHTLPA